MSKSDPHGESTANPKGDRKVASSAQPSLQRSRTPEARRGSLILTRKSPVTTRSGISLDVLGHTVESETALEARRKAFNTAGRTAVNIITKFVGV